MRCPPLQCLPALALAGGPPVGPALRGIVAAGAGKRAAAREPWIEEQPLTEPRLRFAIGIIRGKRHRIGPAKPRLQRREFRVDRLRLRLIAQRPAEGRTEAGDEARRRQRNPPPRVPHAAPPSAAGSSRARCARCWRAPAPPAWPRPCRAPQRARHASARRSLARLPRKPAHPWP